MEVRFQHWEYEIADELLIRYGSPFFSWPDAGHALLERLLAGASMVSSQTINFQKQQILCANEVFPEAAVAEDCRPNELHGGKRFFDIKQRAEGSTLERVRMAADEWIFMANLAPVDLHQVQARWRRSWGAGAEPLTIVDGYPVWRGGWAAYCIGPETLDNRILRLGRAGEWGK